MINPLNPITSTSCFLASSNIFSAGTITPRSITSKPLQAITTPTIFLPISCTSPLTVAIRTFPRLLLSALSFSRYGIRYATAFFITRADFTTCGRNILPSPNKSPTTFIPSIKGPSITLNGLSNICLASSVSWSMNSTIPLTKACSSLLVTSIDRQASSTFFSLAFPFTLSAKSKRRSVASSRLFNKTSSTRSRSSLGISLYISSIAGFTIPISIPCLMAWYKNDECMASRTVLFPLNEKETLLTPPLTLAPGRLFFIQSVALKKSSA